MKASRAILWLALASVAVSVLATDTAPADIDVEVQKNKDYTYTGDKGNEHHNHHHKYGSYGGDHEKDKSSVITLKIVDYVEDPSKRKEQPPRVGNMTTTDTEERWGATYWGSDIACGARRGTNEKGDKGGKATESPKINWDIQDVDIIGDLDLETEYADWYRQGGSAGHGSKFGREAKQVMIGNSPAWQIGEMTGNIDFKRKAATCDPLLAPSNAKLRFKKSEVPVYAMITKAAIPADYSLLFGAEPGDAARTSAESTPMVHTRDKLWGSAPCGIAIVAKGGVRLRSGDDKYKGTVETTLAWTNNLFTLPGGFSTGHPFLADNPLSNLVNRGSGLQTIVDVVTEFVQGSQLWAMCNDAVPISTPGEMKLYLNLKEREKWGSEKEDLED